MMLELSLFFGFVLASPEPLEEIQRHLDRGQLDEATGLLEELTEPVRSRFEGLIALRRNEPRRAADAFERATVAAEEDDAILWLHLAHARLLADEPEGALQAAEKAKSARSGLVAQPLLEARALEALGDRPGAYAVLVEAVERFPEETRPLLELAALAHDADLRGVTRRWALRYVERTRASGRALDLEEAEALFDLCSSDPEALSLLETVAAHFPRNGALKARLARAWAEQERWSAAARLFEEATRLGSNHAFEAADQLRLSGRHEAALRMNALVADPERRTSQRLTILFESRAYARVVAMPQPPDEPASLYRRAYAHHALGQRSRAATLARELVERGEGSDSAYVDSAQSLLEAMGWEASTE